MALCFLICLVQTPHVPVRGDLFSLLTVFVKTASMGCKGLMAAPSAAHVTNLVKTIHRQTWSGLLLGMWLATVRKECWINLPFSVVKIISSPPPHNLTHMKLSCGRSHGHSEYRMWGTSLLGCQGEGITWSVSNPFWCQSFHSDSYWNRSLVMRNLSGSRNRKKTPTLKKIAGGETVKKTWWLR